ncbi:unnamed protein product, partial [marine sediment metagenome]
YSPRPIKESIENSINWFKEQGILYCKTLP